MEAAGWRHGAPLPRLLRLHDIAAQARGCASPAVTWRQIDGCRRAPAPSPAFMFGGAGADVARALFGQVDAAAAGCFSIKDAAIGPDGLVIKETFAFFGDSIGSRREQAKAAVRRVNARAATTRQAPGSLVSLFGTAFGDEARLITDVMPLLWVLAVSGLVPGHLLYVQPAGVDARAFAYLQAVGLSEDRFVTCQLADEVVRAPRVLVPALLRDGPRFSPFMGEATRYWTEQVRNGLALPQARPACPVFLSPRDTAEPSGVADWQAIEAAAVNFGFEVVHPASLSLGERASAFGEADCLLGFDGAALMEACAFAPAGIPVCAIRGNVSRGVELAGFAQALGHRFGYVFGHADGEDRDAPAVVQGDALRLALRALSLVK
jgi:capsular polysaccharide biosynthesis protein